MIPPQLGELTHLSILDPSHNYTSGEIPPDLQKYNHRTNEGIVGFVRQYYRFTSLNIKSNRKVDYGSVYKPMLPPHNLVPVQKLHLLPEKVIRGSCFVVLLNFLQKGSCNWTTLAGTLGYIAPAN
ncbi:unnamed protein product [Coffea canephora]|uniref:Uncharacterized protein n=1 Tax=Coffea canephora TaxID=49390 RepID=A0A068UUD6_COFCA|nr:unnamed protein product [Coffea canephora]